MTHIHGLRIRDFMRIELVELQFHGPGLELVTGNNGQGKSSLIRALWAALAGKEALPDEPVRKGEAKAEVVVDLGDRVVTLRVKPDRTTSLTVEGKDGAVYRSPQKLLDDLVGSLTFDPLLFAEMSAEEQAATLRGLVGLDTAALDAERERAYVERTGVNRETKMLEGQLAGIVVPPEPTAPPPAEVFAEVSVADIARQQREALAVVAANDRQRGDLEVLQHRLGVLDRAADELAERIARLQAEHAERLAAIEEVRATLADKRAAVEALVDPDIRAIETEMAEAETTNARARVAAAEAERARQTHERQVAERDLAARMRTSREQEIAAKQADGKRLTERIEEIDAEKTARLAATAFPCAGLSVDGDRVLYNGVPLEQAASSEQLRVCLTIASALNPTLKLLLVRQGNDLDPTRLRQVAEWATENGYQILMERVATDHPAGIVIEAGRVVADHRETGVIDEAVA